MPRTAPAGSLTAEAIVTTVEPAAVTIVEPEVLEEAVDAEKEAVADIVPPTNAPPTAAPIDAPTAEPLAPEAAPADNPSKPKKPAKGKSDVQV